MSVAVPTAGVRAVLADTLPRSAVRDVAMVVGAALLTAAASRLVIPLGFSPASITGATFAVLVTGAALGPFRGAAGQALYVALGAFGLPFFTGGGSGVAFLAGATGGYPVGFVLAAALVGWCARRGWDGTPWGTAAAFALGSAVIYLVGVPWLAAAGGFGLPEAVRLGLLPFLVGDALKAVLAAAVLPVAWRLAGDRP
ncbi:biotin transporter BioY [soil metagenome]|nr:biotin transporter BioY [Euzebyaceae bacterium]